MSQPDPHSHYDPDQGTVEHIDWIATVDFDSRTIEAALTVQLNHRGGGMVDLDGRGLDIASVETADGEPVPFSYQHTDDILGDRLQLELPGGSDHAVIRYRTTPDAVALQWLAPHQTAGGRHPFLYSQSQTIHARSFLPLQDSALARVTFTAAVTVPESLTVLMAAEFAGRDVRDGTATYRFEMPRTVPPYLISFLVGELTSRELTGRTRVWAEPETVDAAAWEFAGIGEIFSVAEQVLGPYEWGDRFDLVVLPPSYPYGGMENPGLAFLTPTLLAGDRSLVNVAAHELAHHWSGNLVTNASYDDFWLNEGFTVYAERRIIEALDGEDVAAMHASIGWADLAEDLEYWQGQPELTQLHRDLRGVDPDKASSYAALEKGYLFLRAIEEAVGRPAFDLFLRGYLARHRFTSITTAEFLLDARSHLGEVVDFHDWLEGSGLPSDAPEAVSPRLDAVRGIRQRVPDADVAGRWSAVEWQVYLSSLDAPVDAAILAEIDRTFGLTETRNDEIRFWWLLVALRSGYPPAVDATIDMVERCGRLKFLKPLYDALAEAPGGGGELARATFARCRDFYHPIAQTVVASRLS